MSSWRLPLFLAVFGCLFSSCHCLADSLAIANHTSQDIINIHIKNQQKDFFLRLDLLPGATDSVENPDVIANLRVDTGLQLWRFNGIDLKTARALSFYPGDPIFLDLASVTGKITRITGTVESLVPGKGSPPVCALDQFHPAMTMKEVCAIFPGQMPRDDNGAILTGLGFAGMTWAGRLIPSHDEIATENSLLEHLELRRPLNFIDAENVLKYLFTQGYLPWQAEFPGKEVELGKENAANAENEVLAQARRFISQWQDLQHGEHASGKKCAEATILLAPAAMLPELESADEPENDVQLFTVSLRPCTDILLVDVASYRKTN